MTHPTLQQKSEIFLWISTLSNFTTFSCFVVLRRSVSLEELSAAMYSIQSKITTCNYYNKPRADVDLLVIGMCLHDVDYISLSTSAFDSSDENMLGVSVSKRGSRYW